MLRRLCRISLALVVLLSSEVWALGLGEIRLQSALNEPLHAEIELLSATPEELSNLQIAMASAETFERYGLDRPVFLQNIQFRIIRSGSVSGNFIEARSAAPITEPFVTFLVEANWARGRLLREYTVLLDPPTFAPPESTPAPVVTAPTRAEPADSGRIERAAPPPAAPAPAPVPRATQPQPQPQSQPQPQPQPQAQPAIDDSPYDTAAGRDLYVERGQTLWGIAQRVRPDDRLTINQTMVAIFESNRDAFGGNINLLQAGASLRIPSADEIFRISRGEALTEVQRQNEAWGRGEAPVADDAASQPSLTLVPPDEDYVDDSSAADSLYGEEPLTREQELEQRIDELVAEVPQQPSLIEIRDNELAALRQELAEIRGETFEPAVEEPQVDEPFVDDLDAATADEEVFVDGDEFMADEAVDEVAPVPDEPVADDVDAADEAPQPAAMTRRSEPSLIENVLGILTNFWTILVAALVVVAGLLFWFMRRGRDDVADEPEAWRALDADDESLSATETLRAPTRDDDAIVVVEQQSSVDQAAATIEAPAPDFDVGSDTAGVATAQEAEETGQFGSLEDTFSSETAVNLDQTDPIAEADFHMAYGLYDQAADLVNGALEAEPDRQDYLSKLCEIYFVWGNRDAFVDAATRLNAAIGGGESSGWDKIVIMGQQIAADDALFAGAGVAGATKAIDLSFEGEGDEAGALDMELFDDSGVADEVVDLGYPEDEVAEPAEGIDFDFEATGELPGAEEADLDRTAEMALDEGTAEMPAVESTVEMPPPEPTAETPTIEQQFDQIGGTAELPSLDEDFGEALAGRHEGDETSEINLDELGLDLTGLEETEIASFDDTDTTSDTGSLAVAGFDELLDDEALGDEAETTGKNPEVDPNSTGVQRALSIEDTGIDEAIEAATDVNIDENLLDATGHTQVLSPDVAVETAADVGAGLSDDEATMLAPGYDDGLEEILGDDQETLLGSLDDEDDFDFAKTEALSPEAYTGDPDMAETGELPVNAGTDVDLDLDDLTAALEVSAAGETINQISSDATVEQPRPSMDDVEIDATSTMALGPEDMSDDLYDARTMTEVGTKLDLARAYVDMGDPAGARSILDEVLDEGDEGQRQQAQQLLDSLPA